MQDITVFCLSRLLIKFHNYNYKNHNQYHKKYSSKPYESFFPIGKATECFDCNNVFPFEINADCIHDYQSITSAAKTFTNPVYSVMN